MKQRTNPIVVLACLATMILVSGCPTVPPTDQEPDPQPNQAPIANAGDDQVVSGGDLATLDASGSSDPDGDALVYAWVQAAGPAVDLESPAGASASFAAPNISVTLRFALTVTDPDGLSSSDTVSIVVEAVDNLPPVADAGDDLNVDGGAFVTLDGTGSFDPDDDPISYIWRQTAGVDIALDADDVASPDFTVPNIDGSLEFELTVDDGRGLTSSDRITVTIARISPTLFVTDWLADRVLSFTNADTANGNVSPQTILEGENTGLAAPTDVVIIASGALVVSNADADLVSFFSDFSVEGDVAPTATTPTELDLPRRVAYSESHDVIFVSNVGTAQEISVFEPQNPDQGFLVSPLRVRTIRSDAFDNPTGLAFVSTDHLYVVNNSGRNVLVFSGASSAFGDIDPERVINSTAFVDPIDVLVDESDRLLVLNASGQVNVFANASTLGGSVEPASTLSIEGAQAMTALAVDGDGVGYLLDGGAGAIYIFDDLANRAGSSLPDRTIMGADTGLQGPVGVYVLGVR